MKFGFGITKNVLGQLRYWIEITKKRELNYLFVGVKQQMLPLMAICSLLVDFKQFIAQSDEVFFCFKYFSLFNMQREVKKVFVQF